MEKEKKNPNLPLFLCGFPPLGAVQIKLAEQELQREGSCLSV